MIMDPFREVRGGDIAIPAMVGIELHSCVLITPINKLRANLVPGCRYIGAQPWHRDAEPVGGEGDVVKERVVELGGRVGAACGDNALPLPVARGEQSGVPRVDVERRHDFLLQGGMHGVGFRRVVRRKAEAGAGHVNLLTARTILPGSFLRMSSGWYSGR